VQQPGFLYSYDMDNTPEIIQEEMRPTNSYVRLLFCHTCRSVDSLPDYSGPAEYDHYLNYRTQQHQSEGHPHRGLMCRVQDDIDVINATIDELEETVKAALPGTGPGLGQVMYDLRDNFQAEAMQCWKRHGRTTDCDEYRSDAKRLWLDTKADRRAENMPTNKDDRPNVWLCDHCPMHSIVEQKKNKAKGLDK
jgi:hypothetical protein